MEGDKITSELSKELDVPVHLINRWKREYLAEQAEKEKEREVFNPWTQEEILRDRIALAAMAAMIPLRDEDGCEPRSIDEIALESYLYATAMLEARDGKLRY